MTDGSLDLDAKFSEVASVLSLKIVSDVTVTNFNACDWLRGLCTHTLRFGNTRSNLRGILLTGTMYEVRSKTEAEADGKIYRGGVHCNCSSPPSADLQMSRS